MSFPFEARFMGATLVNVGLLSGTTFPVAIKPPPFCMGMQVKAVSGGTLWILPNQVAGASVGGATAITTLNGYPLAIGTDMFPFGPAAFYLAASGSSGTVAINFMFSAGATLL